MLRPGDVVRYSTSAPGEEKGLFVVIEAHYDVPVPRVRIRLLNSGMSISAEEVLAASELQKVG